MQALSPLCPSMQARGQQRDAGLCEVAVGWRKADDALLRYFINTAINIYREAIRPSCWLCSVTLDPPSMPIPYTRWHPLVTACARAASSPKWAVVAESSPAQQLHPFCAQQMAQGAAVLPHHGASSFPDCSRLRVAGHNIFLFSFPCSPAYFTICCTDF